MTWVPSTPPVPQIKGPFGFGTGVNMSISRHQCLVHKGYNVTVDQCSANPANCTLGFSLSVWINVNITQNYFDSINDTTGHLTTFQTIVSTGGDTNGHPGVRLSLYGVWIYALLSTGNLYWEASTIGQFGTRNWTNIGIRWAPPSLNDSGLEVFVNQKKQAQTMSPQTAAASKSALNPPQMMVGCHMDADNTTYRNYADALIDELATWTKELNDTETLYFTGGYAWEFANQTAESFASQVSGADMNDPETAATVINGLQNMIADQTTQNSMPSPTQATSATTAGTQASPTAVPPTTALTDFQTLLNVVNTITKGGNAPQNITATQCNKILSLYGAVSNLFSVNNVGNIEAIQERKDNAGSAQVMENVANWTSALIRQVRYVNTTIPLNFTQVTDNILMMAIKRNLSEWRASGQAFIVSPNYSTLSLSSLWDYPYDRAAVPVGLVSDPDCGNRAINVEVISSRTYDLTAFTLVNVARMPDSDYYEVGSHTLTVRVDCDPPTTNNTNYTKAADECQPTPEALLNNPIRLKLRHTIVESYVTRSLKFHDQERKKTILHRYCVWWNPALSDFGVWDSTGCYILETTDKYTKCACAQLGTFAIMALQTEPKVVPVDAVWLTVLRYIGYGLSFLFIIIYILVVAFSSDLKDQFHLMGANLAVGVLMGTVFMVVSDLNSVRSSRHSCTAVGTLLHLFYQGAGAAVFTLGHASFNAITSGVIGGLLRAYLPISWGLPLISVGLTYLLFLFDLGEDPRCFISWENSPKYVFFGFQMFFVFFSFIHASIVLCNVSTPALRKDNLIDDYGSFCRGAAYVTLFFDLTWVFGLLCYLHLGFTEPDFYPIFQVLNSWTGLVVFLFIGMGSRRFKMVVAGQAHLRRQMLFGNAFGTSSAVPEYKEVLNTPEDEYNGAIESTPSDKSSPVTNSQLQVQRAQDKAPFLPPPSPVPGQID
ncbi:adhesion G-protein coupled receptor G2-like [Cherax quadricarinatus]